MKKILILGDSFAADWSHNNNSFTAWWQMLSDRFQVKNMARAGIGEYKILQQVKQYTNDTYDHVIISHTSPFRIHTLYNPFHKKGLHRQSDLIYLDVYNQPDSDEKTHCLYFFENLFDTKHAIDIHWLIRQEIYSMLQNLNFLSLNFFDDEIQAPYDINLHNLWKQYPGEINHLNAQGHELVHDIISAHLTISN